MKIPYEVMSAGEHDRLAALYGPLTDDVRGLIQAALRTEAEQDAIASEVATMAPGERRPWHIDHTIPIGNEHGEVRVTRDIPNRLTPCKELV